MSAPFPRDAYRELLESKFAFQTVSGFDIDPKLVNPRLKEHIRALVPWGLKGGRRAFFLDFGLAKTSLQIELMRLISAHTGLPCLIVLPLGVRQEFFADAAKLFRGKHAVRLKFIRGADEIEDGHDKANPHPVYLTNYETVRDGKLDPGLFVGASLDEAAVLRSYGSKTYQEFLPLFVKVPYRFLATATPAPNRLKELIHYSAFLGILDSGDALAQPLDAKILTPTGWREMGSINVGDEVFAVDGRPTKVIGVYPQGEKPIYRVTFSDGTSTECTEEHLWLTRSQYERNNERRYRLYNGPGAPRCGKYATIKTTSEIASSLVCIPTGAKNHQIPMPAPIQLTPRPVEVNPWLLGVLIGDGHLRETSIALSTADTDLVERVGSIVKHEGLVVRKVPHVRKDGAPNHDYSISNGCGKGSGGGRGHETNSVLKALRRYGLLCKRAWEKRIPEAYLLNSPEVRLEVLRGLMDTDGSIAQRGNNAYFLTTSAGLAEDVRFLVQSFGGTATIRTRRTEGKKAAKFNGRPIVSRRDQYHVSIVMPEDHRPFWLPRKVARIKARSKYFPARYIASVEPVGVKPAQCIAVEHSDHLYLTDHCIVTHNTRFFQRNSEKANDLTLYPHRELEFWHWLHSWAVFLQKPSDLGYPDAGYVLPERTVVFHEVPSDHAAAGADRDGQGLLLANPAIGVQAAAAEKRSSMAARIARLMEIVGAADQAEQWVIWADLNDEQTAIGRGLAALGRTVCSLTGSQDIDEREAELEKWKARERQDFVSKPTMYGAGVNLQQARLMAFAGVGYQFHDFIQGIHRCFRFGQTRPVEVHVIHSEAERPIVAELQRKWREHDEMRAKMAEIIREHGLDHTAAKERLRRTIGVRRVEARGERWTAWNNDTVLECRNIPDASVAGIITSPPFGNQYEYVSAYEDFGHCSNMDVFWAQMDHLTPELFRILWPGRLACIHVKDRILFGNVTGQGVPTVLPFHAQAIFHYQKHGFQFMGMITVVTDVVRENNQTYRLGYTEMCKDGTKMGVGSPEYILLMRKPQSDLSRGYADMPVVKDPAKYSLARWQLDAHAFWRSSGNRLLTTDELIALGPQKMAGYFPKWTIHAGPYDYEQHVAMGEAIEERRAGALPRTFMGLAPGSADPGVWHDVNRMLTLNGDQARRNVELHVCPLQLQIVDRLIERYSNPDELIMDPFMGIGSVPYRALLKGRRGAGAELHPGYFRDAIGYLRAAEQQASVPDLFGIPDEKEAA